MERLLTGLLYVIGIFSIIVGALSVFATDLARKKFFNKILEIKDLKKYSPLPIIIGILLLLATPYNRYMFFILLLGVLSIIKGIAFVVATEKMEKMKDWWSKLNDNGYRIYGILMIIIGSVVLMGI
jgi:uncharacterized protein YjeT (DUF2065 family)